MPTETDLLPLKVTRRSALTDQIVELQLEHAEGRSLPGFTPGAHISVRIPPDAAHGTGELWRSYSLVHLDPTDNPAAPQRVWRIGVRREEASAGGSRYIHEAAKVGTAVTARAPVNHFPLSGADDDVVLVAGGIGVTPIAAMLTALVASKRRFMLHYTCRNAAQQAYLAELKAIAGSHMRDYVDDDPARAFSLDKLFGACRVGQPIYICGPKGLIDAVFAEAEKRGWDRSRLHAELFTATAPQTGDAPFEVELRNGRVIQVPADKTLLEALTDADVFIPYDCRGGYCGLCAVDVRSGDIDHRDEILSPEDKASGKVMQACVSRGRGRLLLDL